MVAVPTTNYWFLINSNFHACASIERFTEAGRPSFLGTMLQDTLQAIKSKSG